MPAINPAITPLRWAFGQYNAAKIAGINWAQAAKDVKPILARFSLFNMICSSHQAMNRILTIETRRINRNESARSDERFF